MGAYNTKEIFESCKKYQNRKPYRLRKKREAIQNYHDYHCYCCDDTTNRKFSRNRYILDDYYECYHKYKVNANFDKYLKEELAHGSKWDSSRTWNRLTQPQRYDIKNEDAKNDKHFSLGNVEKNIPSYDHWLDKRPHVSRMADKRFQGKLAKNLTSRRKRTSKLESHRNKYSI